MMMRCLFTRKHCMFITTLMVTSPLYCDSFLMSQKMQPFHIYHQSWSQMRRNTYLGAGRDRRLSTSKTSNTQHTEELKLVSDEEAARQRRIGQMKHRFRKEVKREDRISFLEIKLQKSKTMSQSESEKFMPKEEYAELEGLLKVRDNFQEQYNPEVFTQEHLEFKAMHNDALIQLSKFCEHERKQTEPINVFFLDGPDGGTASTLIEKGGFQPSQCFVANRHKSSCESLRISGGGLLPDENVVHATASEALTVSFPIPIDGKQKCNARGDDFDPDDALSPSTGEDGAFAHKDFAAYYFDGCGGFVPHIISMLSAALLREDSNTTGPIAVGYSLLGGNKDVVKKELAVSRALTIIARIRGMKMVHVLDDPLRYGISPDIQKIGGSNDGTFTTWLLLQDVK